MNKYNYKFCVYKNNMRDGVYFVSAHKTLAQALTKKGIIEYSGGGCCDVVKKRFKAGENVPASNYIYNCYKYSEYDL